MKILKILVICICVVAFAVGALMFWKAKDSRSMNPELGIINGKLKACGPKPNCVSSFAATDSSFYVPPLKDGNVEVLWDDLNMLLPELGLEIINHTDNYIHARATTPLLKFVDDVEFLLVADQNLIHMRSASRVGYSDMGANKKRLEKIRSTLTKE